jgi:3-phosphoshikimate 1-carboxyvinyltransferase
MRIEPITRLVGHLAVPGDKSISHRAVLLGALCDGETRITGFGRSADTEATIEAVRSLGITVYEHGEDTLHVFGKGLRGLVSPGRPIDCANAGTLVRLLSGILAGQNGQQFELTGDASLSARPMKRVTEPLSRMGAGVETEDGHLPMGIDGRPLRPITYELPVASAQVKSAILLAGLYAAGETTVVEPVPTRDHTELMLEAAGATVKRREKSITIQPAERLELGEIEVPGDFSSAAPFIVAATLVPGSELHIHGVNLNPRRTGLLTILERMGGRVTVYNRRTIGGERAGDLDVRSADLVATTVLPAEVPLAIDELPLFALLASCAHGASRLRGAEELRAKESDRVESTVDALRALGQHVQATEDGFRVKGVPTRPRGGRINSRGDHRIAMLGAIAALDSQEGVEIEGAGCVAVSFPGFFELLDSLRREAAA